MCNTDSSGSKYVYGVVIAQCYFKASVYTKIRSLFKKTWYIFLTGVKIKNSRGFKKQPIRTKSAKMFCVLTKPSKEDSKKNFLWNIIFSNVDRVWYIPLDEYLIIQSKFS